MAATERIVLSKSAKVWLFDLDNTLHNASHQVFGALHVSMTEFIERELQLSREDAMALRAQYWRRYGATLLGLVRHHGVRAAHFLHETHRLPELDTHSHAQDVAALKRLRGRKYILTNAPAAYAQRVLLLLGMAHLFDGVIPIEGMSMFGNLRPKPDARMFRHVVARLRVKACRCVLVEDTLEHQKSARAVGIQTVWMQRWVRLGPLGRGPQRLRLARKPVYVNKRVRTLRELHRR